MSWSMESMIIPKMTMRMTKNRRKMMNEIQQRCHLKLFSLVRYVIQHIIVLDIFYDMLNENIIWIYRITMDHIHSICLQHRSDQWKQLRSKTIQILLNHWIWSKQRTLTDRKDQHNHQVNFHPIMQTILGRISLFRWTQFICSRIWNHRLSLLWL